MGTLFLTCLSPLIKEGLKHGVMRGTAADGKVWKCSPGASSSEGARLGGELRRRVYLQASGSWGKEIRGCTQLCCLPLSGCEGQHLLIVRRFPTPLWPNEGPGQTKDVALLASIADVGLSAP